MERPGFNPRALARKPGSQRSGANKENKENKTAQSVRSPGDGGLQRSEMTVRALAMKVYRASSFLHHTLLPRTRLYLVSSEEPCSIERRR